MDYLATQSPFYCSEWIKKKKAKRLYVCLLQTFRGITFTWDCCSNGLYQWVGSRYSKSVVVIVASFILFFLLTLFLLSCFLLLWIHFHNKAPSTVPSLKMEWFVLSFFFIFLSIYSLHCVLCIVVCIVKQFAEAPPPNYSMDEQLFWKSVTQNFHKLLHFSCVWKLIKA